MSTHKVEVVRLGPIVKHGNADTLGIVKIWGYTAITRLGEFKEGDLAVYVEPDYVLPDRPEYAWLKGHLRIRAKRLRGVWSQGLLLKPPPEVHEGDNVMELLGIVRYEPKTPGKPGAKTGGDSATPPYPAPVYDLESLRRHSDLLREGEMIECREKLHGCNARFVYKDNRMHCGSRTRWVKPPRDLTTFEKIVNYGCRMLSIAPRYYPQSGSVWWSALKQNPWIEKFCSENQDLVLYGEVFGQVQDLKYGAEKDQYFVKIFDVWSVEDKRFLNVLPEDDDSDSSDLELISLFEEHGCPVVYLGPYKGLEHLEELSRQDSLFCPGQLSEGIVVRPLDSRQDDRVGRVVLKLVSDRYLERA